MRIFSCFIIIFYVLSCQIRAKDTSNIDSLLQELDTSSVKNKILIYNRLFELTYINDSVRAIEYFNKAKNEVDYIEDYSQKLAFVRKIGITLRKKGAQELAINYYYEVLKNEDKRISKIEESRIYNEIGNCYHTLGDYEESLNKYRISLQKIEKSDHKKEIANSYNNIGISYKNLGKYEKSLENHLLALNIREEINDLAGKLMSYNNIGHIYYYWSDNDKAIDFFKKALILSEGINNEENVAIIANNIGSVYNELKDYKNAIQYYEKSLKIYQKLEYDFYVTILYANIASIYNEQGRTNLALNYYIKSLNILRRFNNKNEIARRLKDIGNVYFKINDLNKALKYAKQSLIIAQQNQNHIILLDNYSLIYEIYKAQNDFNNALKYLENYYHLKDSIFNEEKYEQIADMQLKYERERKNREIQIRELKVKRQRLIIVLISSGLIVFFVLIVFYIKQNRKVQIINRKLEYEQRKITDSIEYAEKIQRTILPPKEIIDNVLTNYFIFYKPCSTISGDFYWIDKKDGKVVVAAADCTGHGVPGGLLSTLGIALLKESIAKVPEVAPQIILDNLNISLNAALHQTAIGSSDSNDGMEIGLLVIDYESMIIQFSGAKSKLLLIRKKEIKTIIGNKRAIGYQEREKAFVNNLLKIMPGDNLYLFTDGIEHQFGGSKNKMFSFIRLKNMLLENSYLQPNDQQVKIDRRIVQWMKNQEQLDDMLLIGIKI